MLASGSSALDTTGIAIAAAALGAPVDQVGPAAKLLDESNCMRRLRAALGAAIPAGAVSCVQSNGPEVMRPTSIDKEEEEEEELTEIGLDKSGKQRQCSMSDDCRPESKQNGLAGDEEEDKDELTSLPDTVCSGSAAPNQVANNNGKQTLENQKGVEMQVNETEAKDQDGHQGENEEEDEPEEESELEAANCCAATCGCYSKQFNRLDPSRRSFSSPAVNLLLFGGGNLRAIGNSQMQQVGNAAGASSISNELGSSANQINGIAQTSNYNIKQQQAREKGTGNSSNNTLTSNNKYQQTKSNSGKLSFQTKQRRRTALGLISLGSAHFRMNGSSGANCPNPHASQQPQVAANQKQATTTSTWRHWFTGASSSSSNNNAAKQELADTRKTSNGSRKFLLRSLRPRLLPGKLPSWLLERDNNRCPTAINPPYLYLCLRPEIRCPLWHQCQILLPTSWQVFKKHKVD